MRSTAWFISYDVRPSKQVERRIVLECLQVAQFAGISVQGLPFVGMGGCRFVDFLLAHKIVGVKKFTSIEHDADLLPRCEFNKPFGNISLFSGSASEYMATEGFPHPAIVWFDYERPITEDLREDLISMAGAVQPGSFVFITASGEVPSALAKTEVLPQRLNILTQQFGDFAAEVKVEQLSNQKFYVSAAKLMASFLSFGFKGRADGVYWPFLRVAYRDSRWMITVGGFFGTEEVTNELKKQISKTCSFLKPKNPDALYEVEQFNITDAERRIFDRAALATKGSRSAKMQLRRLGFPDSTIQQYGELIRYIPRYFESLL
jgi:hypothetical protein